MSIAAFLSELQRRDVRVWAEGDNLRCDAPAGVLTPELREQLRRKKKDVLDFLRAATARSRQERAIVPLQPSGGRTPVFGVAGHNGDVFCYRALARHLGEERPFYGLQPPGLDGHGEPLNSVEDLAAYFAADIRAFHPDGPYIVAGYCAGGTVAFELARQLRQSGADVRHLALFGSPYSTWYRWPMRSAQRVADKAKGLVRHARELASRAGEERLSYLRDEFRKRQARLDAQRAPAPDAALARRALVERITLAAVKRYRPAGFPGRVDLFLPSRDWRLVGGAEARWQALAALSEKHFGPDGCDGYTMLLEPHAPAFATLLRRVLQTD